MGEVGEAFVQALEHRAKLSSAQIESIPVIDLSALANPGSNIDKLVSEIGDACKNWGFFEVINHGVPQETRQKLETAAKKFFALPLEEKKKVKRALKTAPVGYYESEFTKNVRDWKEVFDYAVHDPMRTPLSPDPDDKQISEWYNRWPQNPPEFREACEEYSRELEKLSYKLMELIALSLGLPADRFNSFFEEQISFVRLNYYPPCPAPDLALGVGRHKDSGGLTILCDDEVIGLQVKRKSDGEWVTVKGSRESYIINIGEIIQVWCNDAYESVDHRAMLNTEKERFSFPFFFDPGHSTVVQPFEEMISEQNPPKYRPYNWGKFFTTRRLSNFMKLKIDNIQIGDFKVRD